MAYFHSSASEVVIAECMVISATFVNSRVGWCQVFETRRHCITNANGCFDWKSCFEFNVWNLFLFVPLQYELHTLISLDITNLCTSGIHTYSIPFRVFGKAYQDSLSVGIYLPNCIMCIIILKNHRRSEYFPTNTVYLLVEQRFRI